MKNEMTNEILALIENSIDKIADDQLEHFTVAIKQMLDCYVDQNCCGALIVANESIRKQTLIAINADEDQIEQLIDRISSSMTPPAQSRAGKYVN